MLQWNSKLTLLVVLALLVAISAFGGMLHGHAYNFTW
jgi:hypothetical protein